MNEPEDHQKEKILQKRIKKDSKDGLLPGCVRCRLRGTEANECGGQHGGYNENGKIIAVHQDGQRVTGLQN